MGYKRKSPTDRDPRAARQTDVTPPTTSLTRLPKRDPNASAFDHEIGVDARRMIIAEHMLAGRESTPEQWAANFGVGKRTIYYDIEIIRMQWRARTDEALADCIGRDLARLERMIDAAWDIACGHGEEQLEAIDRIVKIIALRAKIRGEEAPKAVVIDTRQLAAEIAAENPDFTLEQVIATVEAVMEAG